MRPKVFFIVFIALQPLFIFLHIYRNNSFIRLNFAYQKNLSLKNNLMKKKEQLCQQLAQLQNKQEIKKYAQNFLGMEKITKLRKIKKLDHA